MKRAMSFANTKLALILAINMRPHLKFFTKIISLCLYARNLCSVINLFFEKGICENRCHRELDRQVA